MAWRFPGDLRVRIRQTQRKLGNEIRHQAVLHGFRQQKTPESAVRSSAGLGDTGGSHDDNHAQGVCLQVLGRFLTNDGEASACGHGVNRSMSVADSGVSSVLWMLVTS